MLLLYVFHKFDTMKKLIFFTLLIFASSIVSAQVKRFDEVTVYDSCKVGNPAWTPTKFSLLSATPYDGISLQNNASNAGCNGFHFIKSRAYGAVSNNDQVGALVYRYYTGAWALDTACIMSVKASDATADIGLWRVQCNDGTSSFVNAITKGIFLKANYFGINNNTPAYALDVAGNVNIDSSLTVQSQVLADSSIVCNTIQIIPSAATIIPVKTNNIEVSGTADITSISVSYVDENTILYIMFTGTAATNGVVDGGNLKIEGNFAYSPDDILVIQRRGSNWHEISRSAN